MSIAKLFNVFEILMLIETIIIINTKVISKKPESQNKTENYFYNLKRNGLNPNSAVFLKGALQEENDTESNKILRFLLNAKEKKMFLVDINNVLKFESVKSYFSKKLSRVNEQYDVEFFIFLFDNFNKFMLNKRPKSNFLSRPDKHQNKNNKNYILNNMKKNQGREKNKNSIQNRNDHNTTNSIKRRLNSGWNIFNKTKILKETEKIKDLYVIDNSTRESNLKIKSEFKRTKNENFSFSDFLYKNNLVNSENSIIILISKQDLMIKLFLGERQLKLFSYNDQRKIAENFLRNFIEGNTEFGLDDLIDNMESLLKTQYPVKLIKMVIIFLIFFCCFANFWYKSRKELRNYKDPQEVITNNLAIIKEITKKNLSKKDFREYSDNNCMICLEDILNFNCECHSHEFNPKYNKDKIKIKEKANEFKIQIQSENILIRDYHYKFSSSKLDKQPANESNDESYQYSNFSSVNFKIDKCLNFEIPSFNSYSDHLDLRESNNKDISYFKELEIKENCNTYKINDGHMESKIKVTLDDRGNAIAKESYCSSSSFNMKSSNSSYLENKKSFKFCNLIEVNTVNICLSNVIEEIPKNLSNKGPFNLLDCSINDNKEAIEGQKLKKITNKNDENFAAVLDCRHKFHSSCLALWMSKGSFCPICRTPIELKSDKDTEKTIKRANNFEYLDTDASGDSISILIS